ncbi:MAG: hypothetical protein HZB16_04855 [Armatimonadetes bacterium]|nr:hypothetical protein [Armatimonadota bacterium]
MNDDANVVCGNCGVPLPAGQLACGHCGRQPRAMDVGAAILRGLALFLGAPLALSGAACSLTGLVGLPDTLVVLVIAVPVAASGLLLLSWGAGLYQPRTRPTKPDGTTRMTFGRRDDSK